MPRPITPPPEAHWLEDRLSPTRAVPPRPSRRTSCYVPMRDGVRIAIDVHLPADLAPGDRAPVVLRPTRYFRATAVRAPFSRMSVAHTPDLYLDTRRRFLAAGYAWIDMDVRGSGASFGRQAYPWWTEEVNDGADIVNWIVAQPWSDGRVGALGISYDGTSAELLLCHGHPAVRAVAPLFSVFDVYADVAFPGGVHLTRFMQAWARFNRTLDNNDSPGAIAVALWHMLRGSRPGEAHGLAGRLLGPALDALPEAAFLAAARAALRPVFAGVRPVDGDTDGSLLAQAVAEHASNMDVHASTQRIVSRDDTGALDEIPDGTIDACSPHARAADFRASGAAIYGVSGWRDGAYQHSALKRFAEVTTPGSRVALGPLCHGGRLYASPGHATRAAGFDLDGELLRFFDLHLRGRDDGIGAEPPVHYYTTGEEVWKSASVWPPPGVQARPLYLAPGRGLSWERPDAEGGDDYTVDPRAGTGERSRWLGLLNPFIRSDYPDRRARGARLLVYTSPPLEADLEVTGHPVVTLHVSASALDVTLFVYLEEVTADGDVRYVTEGQLRALHRGGLVAAERPGAAPRRAYLREHAAPLSPGEVAKLVLDLLPVSHRFRRGHAVRLAIAGADCDHFAPPPDPGARLQVRRGGTVASRIDLPVAG